MNLILKLWEIKLSKGHLGHSTWSKQYTLFSRKMGIQFIFPWLLVCQQNLKRCFLFRPTHCILTITVGDSSSKSSVSFIRLILHCHTLESEFKKKSWRNQFEFKGTWQCSSFYYLEVVDANVYFVKWLMKINSLNHLYIL